MKSNLSPYIYPPSVFRGRDGVSDRDGGERQLVGMGGWIDGGLTGKCAVGL